MLLDTRKTVDPIIVGKALVIGGDETQDANLFPAAGEETLGSD